MSDIALVWTETAGDVAVKAGDLVVDDGLQTAILLSLYLDRQAGTGDTLPSSSPDRRGWWADQFAPDDGDLIGSRLWLLERSKRTPAVLTAARTYALEALQWLLDDGVASTLDVVAEWYAGPAVSGLALTVVITKPGQAASSRFGIVWQGV